MTTRPRSSAKGHIFEVANYNRKLRTAGALFFFLIRPDIDHYAAGDEVVDGPSLLVAGYGKKGYPAKYRLKNIADKGSKDIDTSVRIAMVLYPESFNILTQGATKNNEQWLIDFPDSKKQSDPGPVRNGSKFIKEPGKEEHEHANKYAVDKYGLNPVG